MKWRDVSGNLHSLEDMPDDYLRNCYKSCQMRNWRAWAERFEDEMARRQIHPENTELDDEFDNRLSREV